jgi:2-haloacid dehalogenase
MFERPRVVALDVFETLFPLEPLRPRMKALGLPDGALELWFAQVLGNGFALSATRAPRPFLEVAEATLRSVLARSGLSPTAEALRSTLEGFGQLAPHPDVRAALAALKQGGLRVVTLSNGSAAGTERLLEQSRLDGMISRVLSVDAVGVWKPFPEPYQYAARECGVAPEELALVSAHTWDIAGAISAGLTAAWVSRLEKAPFALAPPPAVVGKDLLEVARGLLAAPLGAARLASANPSVEEVPRA